MGTLKILGLTIAVIAAGLVTSCGIYDHPCYDQGMKSDYVAVMSDETEEFLREYGYVPDGECGISTGSYYSFPAWAGSCRVSYGFFRTPEEYYIHRSDVQDTLGTYITTPVRENLPTVNNLVRHYPRYADCLE